jgi:multiple sugar transport system permease protein
MSQNTMYAIESPAAPAQQRNWWVYVILGLVCLLNFIPYYWMVLTAFMDRATSTDSVPHWLFTPTLEAFDFLITEKRILNNLLNSIIVSLGSTFFSVLIGTFAAYALARYEFPGRDDVSFWILTNRMMPPVAVILPIFITFQTLKLLDSKIGLIVLYTALQLPFVVWMLTGYFRDIPKRFEESAMVDGDSWFGAFRKVVLPLMAPAITATSVFVLILSWNEFAFATYMTSINAKTLPPSLMAYAIGVNVQWNILGAACLFITAPIILFVLVVQKQFISGLSQGVVK